MRGHVYVHTVLDDRSRYLVMARAYLRERTREPTNNLWWALKGGRQPKALYVDNGSCFISKEFREYCAGRGISVIYGRPYNPRGRGKLERFHGILTEELVGRVCFHSLGHFRRELTPGGGSTIAGEFTGGSDGQLRTRRTTTRI